MTAINQSFQTHLTTMQYCQALKTSCSLRSRTTEPWFPAVQCPRAFPFNPKQHLSASSTGSSPHVLYVSLEYFALQLSPVAFTSPRLSGVSNHFSFMPCSSFLSWHLGRSQWDWGGKPLGFPGWRFGLPPGQLWGCQTQHRALICETRHEENLCPSPTCQVGLIN